MVELADAQKVRARNELEKLNRGLIVNAKSSELETSNSALIERANDIDVSLAIQVVRDTMEALEEFRTIASTQNEKLEKAIVEKSQIVNELNKLRSKHEEVVKELSELRSSNLNLSKTRDQLYEDRNQLLEHNKIIENRLKELVGVVIESFRKGRDKKIE